MIVPKKNAKVIAKTANIYKEYFSEENMQEEEKLSEKDYL